MNSEQISYYALNIHPSKINVYYQLLNPRYGRNINNVDDEPYNRTTTKQPIQFKDNYHQGRLSAIAKRKMARSIDYLVHMSKPKKIIKPYHGKNFTFTVNFITLTLSSKQIHTDQVIKSELLNQFLIEMTSKWNVDKYVWKAEKQDNGNIHFHIITGNFIPWNELRNVWNRIQQKLGYVTRYRENRLDWHKHGFKYDSKHSRNWPYERQLKAYRDGMHTGWDNPNSVDIHSLKHIGNIKAYMIKYMSKNRKYSEEEKEKYNRLTEKEKYIVRSKNEINGRLWSCSKNLVKLEGGHTECCSVIYDELKRIKEYNYRSVYDSDYFHVYTVDISILIKLNCTALLSCFEDFIRKKFPDDYLPVIR